MEGVVEVEEDGRDTIEVDDEAGCRAWAEAEEEEDAEAKVASLAALSMCKFLSLSHMPAFNNFNLCAVQTSPGTEVTANGIP